MCKKPQIVDAFLKFNPWGQEFVNGVNLSENLNIELTEGSRSTNDIFLLNFERARLISVTKFNL